MGRDEDQARILAELYGELRARAGRLMRGQPPDLTLQATALVHEACLKLLDKECLNGADRSQCLAFASTAMRNLLVDHARARGCEKRQPQGKRVPLDELQAAYEECTGDLLTLDDALRRLAQFDPEMARGVDLRLFGGLSHEELADELAMSLRTFERRWAATKAWLKAEVG